MLLGHRPDPPNLPRHVGAHFAGLLYGAQATPQTVSNRDAVIRGPGIGAQKTNSCVGYQIRGMLEATLTARGTPVPRKSAVAIYDFARLKERRQQFPGVPPENLPELLDLGCIPSLGVQAVMDEGIPPLEDREDDPDTINTPPALEAIEDAADFRLEGFSRIDTTDQEDKVLQLRLACAAKLFPGIAIRARASLESYTSGVWTPAGADMGGHAVYIAGYVTLADGTTIFDVVNHWTNMWGDAGFFQMHEDDVAKAVDCYVLNPRIL